MPSSELLRRMMSRPLVARAAMDQTPIPEDFVGQYVFPDFQVEAFKFDYPVFGTEFLEAEDDDAVGAMFGEYKETKISEGTDTATLFERGRKAKIAKADIQAAQNAERLARAGGAGGNAVFNLKVRIASVIRAQHVRRSEYIKLKLLTTASLYSASHRSGGVGSPIAATVNVRTDAALREKIQLAVQKIGDDTGLAANLALVGRGAMNGMDLNPAVVAALPDNAPKFVTREFLTQYIGLPTVYKATALTKKTAKSQATPIMDNWIWIGYVDPTVNGGGPTFGRNFWMPYEGGGRSDSNEVVIGPERVTWLSYAEQETPRVVGKDYGFLIETTSAP